MTIETVDTPSFKIENKPVVRPRTRNNKYPFGKMKVGQSFYIDRLQAGEVQSVRTAAAHFGNRNNMKFSVIRDGDGYRCGRIA